MAMAVEMLGISPMGSGQRPGRGREQGRAVAEECGELVMKLLARGPAPAPDHHPRGARERDRRVGASGGSTNAVLHLLAVAHEAGIELTIDDFDAISSRTPLLCDLKPGGRFVATDLYEAGGVALRGQAPRSRRAAARAMR